MRAAFIGGGNITRALLHKQNIFKSVIISDICPIQLEFFKMTGFETTTCNKEAVKNSDLVIFATKPKDLSTVFDTLKNIDLQDTLPISVMANTPSQSFFDNIEINKLIRIMPNTPATVGCGISVWWSRNCSANDNLICQKFLQNIGKEIEVFEENIIDKATALSGSGPAYVLHFIESLIDAGVHIGLTRKIAQELAIETVLGTTQLLIHQNLHPSILKNNITSPAGTTTKGLLALEKHHFKYTIIKAIQEGYNDN